jgi:hypothetical protein
MTHAAPYTEASARVCCEVWRRDGARSPAEIVFVRDPLAAFVPQGRGGATSVPQNSPTKEQAMQVFRSILLATVAVASMSFAPPTGGPDDDNCPHTRAVPTDAHAQFVGTFRCDGGIRIEIDRVRFEQSSVDDCPIFAIVSPAHAKERESPGSNTYADFVAALPTRMITFACKGEYFLFIRLGTYCGVDREINHGAVNHYATRPCAASAVTTPLH